MPIKVMVRVPREDRFEVSEHVFTRETISIGRSPDCDLVLPGDEVRVSRQHAKLISTSKGYTLIDLGSRNGTLLNNVQVKSNINTELKKGDCIKMGSVELLVDPTAGDGASDEESDTWKGGVEVTAPPHPADTAALGRKALEVLADLAEYLGDHGRLSAPVHLTQLGERIKLTLDVLMEGLSEKEKAAVLDAAAIAQRRGQRTRSITKKHKH